MAKDENKVKKAKRVDANPKFYNKIAVQVAVLNVAVLVAFIITIATIQSKMDQMNSTVSGITSITQEMSKTSGNIKVDVKQLVCPSMVVFIGLSSHGKSSYSVFIIPAKVIRLACQTDDGIS